MNLKNYDTIPPGGWIYDQPGTGMKFRDMGPFGACVKQILVHRMSNNLPRATVTEVGQDLEEATCQRLGNDETWCVQKKTQPVPDGFPLPGPGAALAAVGKYKTGLQILRDWLGDNAVAVERSVAENRATVCAGCDKNKPPHFLEKIPDRMAQALHDQLNTKREMGMHVTKEDDLKMCHVCKCHLPLKVWVPMETIMGRMKQGELEAFPNHCWLVKENQLSEIRPMKI